MYGLFLLGQLLVVFRKYIPITNSHLKLTQLLRAGLFWASEGAVALGYPEPSKRGKYMKCIPILTSNTPILTDIFYSIWLWFRTGGPILGGAIVLALNK